MAEYLKELEEAFAGSETEVETCLNSADSDKSPSEVVHVGRQEDGKAWTLRAVDVTSVDACMPGRLQVRRFS
jgi:hypothetical protein